MLSDPYFRSISQEIDDQQRRLWTLLESTEEHISPQVIPSPRSSGGAFSQPSRPSPSLISRPTRSQPPALVPVSSKKVQLATRCAASSSSSHRSIHSPGAGSATMQSVTQSDEAIFLRVVPDLFTDDTSQFLVAEREFHELHHCEGRVEETSRTREVAIETSPPNEPRVPCLQPLLALCSEIQATQVALAGRLDAVGESCQQKRQILSRCLYGQEELTRRLSRQESNTDEVRALVLAQSQKIDVLEQRRPPRATARMEARITALEQRAQAQDADPCVTQSNFLTELQRLETVIDNLRRAVDDGASLNQQLAERLGTDERAAAEARAQQELLGEKVNAQSERIAAQERELLSKMEQIERRAETRMIALEETPRCSPETLELPGKLLALETAAARLSERVDGVEAAAGARFSSLESCIDQIAQHQQISAREAVQEHEAVSGALAECCTAVASLGQVVQSTFGEYSVRLDELEVALRNLQEHRSRMEEPGVAEGIQAMRARVEVLSQEIRASKELVDTGFGQLRQEVDTALAAAIDYVQKEVAPLGEQARSSVESLSAELGRLHDQLDSTEKEREEKVASLGDRINALERHLGEYPPGATVASIASAQSSVNDVVDRLASALDEITDAHLDLERDVRSGKYALASDLAVLEQRTGTIEGRTGVIEDRLRQYDEDANNRVSWDELNAALDAALEMQDQTHSLIRPGSPLSSFVERLRKSRSRQTEAFTPIIAASSPDGGSPSPLALSLSDSNMAGQGPLL